MSLAFRLLHLIFLASLALAVLPRVTLAKGTSCKAKSISLPLDFLPGASIVDIQAHELKNHKVEGDHFSEGGTFAPTCQVTISYIYPNLNTSQVDVNILLPNEWNGRFMGTGGGGWQSAMAKVRLLIPNQEGYAVALTSGGLGGLPFVPTYTMISPGNPNKPALERLGYRAIHEMTLLAKKVIEEYYGRPAKTNIYNGCSTGGRQGLMEASRFPHDYDGIVANAPAVNWNTVLVGGLAGQAIMAEEKYLVSPSELAAITDAAMEACDGLDGLVDGVIARPDLCKFHANAAVGREYKTESGGTAKVTKSGAKIMERLIQGIYATDGEKLTPGYPWGTEVWEVLSIGRTIMDEKSPDQRTFAPLGIAHQWVHDILFGGLEALDYESLTVDELQTLLHRSKLEYDYHFEPQPDLRQFKARGGKLITYHGIEDPTLSAHNTLAKYASVQDTLYPRETMAAGAEKMQDFWRLFLLPGVQHCTVMPGKKGARATTAYRQLVQWVEDGVAPTRLETDQPTSPYANMCLYPSKPYWVNGQLECQDTLSVWHSMPSASEVLTQFIERLPSMLLLEPRKVKSEL